MRVSQLKIGDLLLTDVVSRLSCTALLIEFEGFVEDVRDFDASCDPDAQYWTVILTEHIETGKSTRLHAEFPVWPSVDKVICVSE